MTLSEKLSQRLQETGPEDTVDVIIRVQPFRIRTKTETGTPIERTAQEHVEYLMDLQDIPYDEHPVLLFSYTARVTSGQARSFAKEAYMRKILLHTSRHD